MLAVEENLKKVEAKLLAAVREKTGLSATVTTLERQRTELKKVNEFLKNKVRLVLGFIEEMFVLIKLNSAHLFLSFSRFLQMSQRRESIL